MRAALLAALLVAASLPLLPAPAAASPLLADAGTSQFATAGAPLAVAGRAFFGTAPYAFAWSHEGSAARFASPGSAETTFDTTGLSGAVLLALTVTDAAGAVATDTVRHHVDAPAVVLDAAGFVPFGTPIVVPSGLEHPFTVPAGASRLVGVLDWGSGANDLDLELFGPSGASATGTQGQTERKPERVTVQNPAPGSWRAEIFPFLSGPEAYRVTVTTFGANPLPAVSARGPWAFGQLDAQTFEAVAAGGTTPYAFAWDLDGDGHLEATGQAATAALPVGEHVVKVRLTDAAGFEVESVAAVTVSETDRVLRFQCGGDPRATWMMEFTSTKNTCWIHGGHHTYFTEATLYALRRAHGFVFSVEQQLAWPSEFSPSDPTESPIVVEISRDGDEFRAVGNATYTLLTLPPEGLGMNQRQGIWFGFEVNGNGKQFRFLRIREPKSVTHGLSGYLDNSLLFVHADVVRTVGPKPLEAATRTFSCEAGHILEDFFAEHPCTFGGIDRYDAPSFWHTYYLGEGAAPSRVRGSFTLAPWRSDDWNQGRAAATAANTSAFLQTSVNGVHWTNAAIVPALFGAPAAFDVALDGAGARFVRLFPEYHARYDQTASFAPNHHPRGYFLASNLTVEGMLPADD